MAIEIVDLHIGHGDFPVRELLVYQRVGARIPALPHSHSTWSVCASLQIFTTMLVWPSSWLGWSSGF